MSAPRNVASLTLIGHDKAGVIAQEALRVRPREPLAGIVRRGQALETKCVLRAVRTFPTKRLDVHWGRAYA